MMPTVQVILGAGLSGLSLAVALVRAGVREPILVVDQRTEFGRDRTWCTWDTPGVPFLHLARHRWPAWAVHTHAGAARATSATRPYVHISSEDFYAAALEELERAPQVELRLGERVFELGDGWARTNRERIEGTVHDGLALGSPALARLRVPLWQTFLSWEVRTERPRFEPGVATLMDFRSPQQDGVHFLTVLPFAADHALVTHASFAPGRIARHRREAALRAFLGDGHEVLYAERGRLPVMTRPLPARRSPRTGALGTAGGALRPFSGYAFFRVQAHSAALARAVVRGEPLPRRAGPRRRAALDAVFLHALVDDPETFPEHFRTLLERVPADTFARFMCDRSSPADEARVVAALPRRPFAGAAVKAAAYAALRDRRGPK
jgi:lycopene beta-cyclase